MRAPSRILIVRLGAMGDVIHTLPSAATLRESFPKARISWAIAPKWMPLLEGNPHIDAIVAVERGGLGALSRSWQNLRRVRPELAIDFQGLLQSALVARASGADVIFGWNRDQAREPMASRLYSNRISATASHIVDRNLELARAAGAFCASPDFWIPPGTAEGTLPQPPYILANPFAGWGSKQWPLERYEGLAQALEKDGVALVANVPLERAGEISALRQVRVHSSSLAGLIYATRRASAVLGLDSGPMHLAAALGKPGVALFGPTDPARNGPYGGTMRVLRAPNTATSYRRGTGIDASMDALKVEQVYESLLEVMKTAESRR